jgi:transposase
VRAEELIEGRPELISAIRPLLEARNAVEQQVSELDRKVMKLARHDAQVRRFMTAPGVGPITALAFKATIDDPARFARSRSVDAYVGLTSRRHASGELIGQVASRSAATRCYEVICLKEPGFC